MPKNLEELPEKEREALAFLKNNIKIWLLTQLRYGLLHSNDYTLFSSQEPVFRKFKIESDREMPLLIRALKEATAELKE